MIIKKQVYAVVRHDEFQPPSTPIENMVTVTRVFSVESRAHAEVERLSKLNQDKGCRYFVQVTRLAEDFGEH